MTKPNNNNTFKDVLDKFIHIGNCYYNSKHYDNVLNIFNDLEKEDQKNLLLGVYYLFVLMEHNPVSETHAPVLQPKPIAGESPETEHKKVMTELKIWFVKMSAIFVLISFLSLIVMILFFGGNAAESSGILSRTFKILSMLF